MGYSIYKSNSCSTYTLLADGADIEFRVYKLDTDGLFTEVTTDSIGVVDGESYDYAISTDGVYKFEIIESLELNQHVAIHYCGVRECIANKIEDLLCCCPDTCATVDHYDFNALIAISNGFFGIQTYVDTNLVLRSAGDALLVGVDYEVLVEDASADFSTSGGPGVGAVDVGDIWTATSTDVDTWASAVITSLTGSYLDSLVVHAKAIEMAINYCSDCQTICSC